MKRIRVLHAFVPFTVFIVCAVCLTNASGPLAANARAGAPPEEASDVQAGSAEGCRAAVTRIQMTVTMEAYAYSDARRTVCQFMSLPADMREGKPQAINDSMQQKLREARDDSAAAYKAAEGCDTSAVKRPEIYQKSSVDSYIACVGVHQSCGGLAGAAYDSCLKQEQVREEARARSCQSVLAQVDCAGLVVVEHNGTPETEEESVVTPPADLNPECRDAYLQFVNAERAYSRSEKRVRDIAPHVGAAGARGAAMYNAAREDMQRAADKKTEADKKLKACKALDDGDDSKTATANQPTPPGERPCSADERAAFAKLTGSWKSYPMNINVGGSCEQTTGTYQVAEWCSSVEGPDRSDIYSGSFTGRMEGGSISLNWTQPAGKRHPNLTGRASCTLNGDGSLNCRGFGPPSCGPSDAKKQ